ncbi:hypothetical protein ACFC0C_16345 [Streptomyces sp. NPDC056178]|uniref:hypothetical protein n=1 Tax=unclassified Streptomyces TaxID=2593676 RepID=UPI0035DCDD4A
MEQPHFHFGVHPDLGFTAAPTARVSAHLADWFLTREMFEKAPGTPVLYRLSDPQEHGVRRARQAVHDLRVHGFTVQADYSIDPAVTTTGPPAPVRHGLLERRDRIARAATARSPQRGPALHATPPSPRPAPPKPSYAPAVGIAQSTERRRGHTT